MGKNFFERYTQKQMRSFKKQYFGPASRRKFSKEEIKQLDNPQYDSCLLGCLASVFYVFGFISLLAYPPGGAAILAITIAVHLLIYHSSTSKKRRLMIAANKLLEADEHSKAIPILEKAQKLGVSRDDELLATLAYCYHDNGDYAKAIDIFEDVCERHSGNYEALLLLGNSYFNLEQYENAIKTMQKIPPDHLHYLKALQIIAISFYQLGKTDIAIDTFEKAPLRKKVLNDDLLELHYNLAIIYEDMGELKKALDHFKIVIAHDINYGSARKKAEELENKI